MSECNDCDAIVCGVCGTLNHRPLNVIQVEFRSDEKRIADLEARVAEVEEALLDMARLQRRMAKQQELVLDAFIKLIT